MKANRVHHVLRAVARRALVLDTGRVLALACAAMVGAVLGAVALDAVLALPAGMRITVLLALAGLLVVAAVGAARRAARHRFDARRLARTIESRLGMGHSALINAVDLAEHPSGSPELAAEAVARGEQAADGVAPAAVAPAGPLRRGLAVAGGAVAGLLLAVLLLPGVFQAVVPRYLDPLADHPPFTLVRFDVRLEPGRVLHGRRAAIHVELSGAAVPEQAAVVFVDGPTPQRLPMLRDANGARRAFVLPIDRAERSREFYIDTPAGRSRRYTLTVLPVPTFDKVTLQYAYPGYTAWPAVTQPLGAEGIRGLAGTRATLSIRSNLALKSGRLRLTGLKAADGAEVPDVEVLLRPQAGDAAMVSGVFDLAVSGRYELSLLGADDTPGNDTLAGVVAVVPDLPPRVEISDPGPNLIVPEGWQVPVMAWASDDVRVESIRLFRSINGYGPTAVEMALDRRGPVAASGRRVFDLAELGARAGDVITFFCSATDNYPGQAHFSDTATQVIQVITMEEYLAQARSRYQAEQWADEIEAFRQRLEQLREAREPLLRELEGLEKKLEDRGAWSDAERQQAQRLREQLDRYAAQAWDLARAMEARAQQPRLYEMEEPYQDMLRRTAALLNRQAEKASQAALRAESLGAPPTSAEAGRMAEASRAFREDARAFGQQEKDLAKQQEDLEKLRLANQMLAQLERIAAVVNQQRDVADRLGQFRNKEQLSPSEQLRAQRLAEEQESLRKELAEAGDELRGLAQRAEGKLPKMSASGQRLARRIKELEVERDQADAGQLAQAGAGRQAFTAADSAARKLESLLGDCQAQGPASDDLDGCLGLKKPTIREALAQMSQGRGLPGFGRGGEGGGYYGSRSQWALRGPRQPGGGEGRAAPATAGGGAAGDPLRQGKADDVINPQAATGRGSAGEGLPGVPAKYADQAEAYFKRLADESK